MSEKTNKHLFLFTIGPVQSFIAQARKTQDLYAGSQILSRLVKAAIKEVPNWKDKVVFPILNDENENQSLPNRFVAIVEKPENELKQLGVDIEKKVRAEFNIIADKSLDSRAKPNGFDEQINRHLDIHWAFHLLDKSNYKKSYSEIESLLGSVKNVRPFEQFGNGLGEAGRKCSLDGENNALFFGAIRCTRAKKIQSDGENNALFFGRTQPSLTIKSQRENAVMIKGFLTDEKEGLSAVSFVKRYGVKTNSFPSTAEITVDYDKQQLKAEKLLAFECLEKLFGNERDVIEACTKMVNNQWIKKCHIKELSNEDNWNNQFDYQQLFEENLREKYIPNKEQLRLAKILQKKLASSFKTKYYAVIMFDGDKMGKLLSENASLSFHPKFSEYLANFAKVARGIVNKHGQTVYAGGDDFLGFVNLHCLFDRMIELREAFDKEINENINQGQKLTFSAGIVIAHYKMPLAEVLKTVRKVEKKAKNDGDRNAFCITAMKHSGEIQETVMKWGDDNANWKALQYITKQLIDGVFSNKFITNLTVELYQLAGLELNKIGISNDAIFTEFKRLTKRALIEKSDKVTNENNIKLLVEQLELLYRNSRKTNEKTKNFIHALQIADFLSRKIN
jgi:CRISPR-associated protein Cmr2